MAPKKDQQTLDPQLRLAKELIEQQSKGGTEFSQYQQDLIKWARNIDRRYAWLIMLALWLMMAVTLGPYRVYGLIFAKVTQEGIYTREQASVPVSFIFTVNCLMSPVVSIISYHTSYRKIMLVGGLLTAAGNILAYFSDNLWLDILTIGVVQGIGISFVFIPFMEIINNYFIERRNIALGFALCGGTMAVFVISPLCQYILDHYPWRTAYLSIGWICLLGILLVPLLKPNPRPDEPPVGGGGGGGRVDTTQAAPLALSVRALSRHASIVSVSPYASSVGLERKISRAISINMKQKSPRQSGRLEQKNRSSTPPPPPPAETPTHDLAPNDHSDQRQCGSGGGGAGQGQFSMALVVQILKTPGFHVVWYMQALFLWAFTIFCLIVVDYGLDHGCSQEEAETLLDYQSVGEIFGRMALTALVDLKFLSITNTVIAVLLILFATLVGFTQVQGIAWMASLTVIFSAFACLLYILLNGMLVAFLGERQVTLGFGMASSVVGLLVILRPQAVGYFRDTIGSYDPLMLTLAGACLLGIVLCLLEPIVTARCCRRRRRRNSQEADDHDHDHDDHHHYGENNNKISSQA